MVSNGEAALEYIKREYETVEKDAPPLTEPLDGDFSRVWLSWLNVGLAPETLSRLFCLSAKEHCGENALKPKLEAVRALINSRALPFEEKQLEGFIARGCPPVHHSDAFRASYHPAYRVISNKYARFLQVFAKIDSLISKGEVIVAIEGGSASGKSTLGEILSSVYDCSLFHMDDFFLRPEQRTSERLAEIGGNVDRERFYSCVLVPLMGKRTVVYRPFDCSVGSLGNSITVPHKRLTVVEGVYSMHPSFGEYYDLAVLLDINKEYQQKRVLARNPRLAPRFFNEWIPMEDNYLKATDIPSRAHLVLKVTDRE